MDAGLFGDMAITSGRRDHGVGDCTLRRNLNQGSFMLKGSVNTKRLKLYTEPLSLEILIKIYRAFSSAVTILYYVDKQMMA